MTEKEQPTFKAGYQAREALERNPSLQYDLVAAYFGLAQQWDDAAQREGTVANRRDNFFGFYLNGTKLLPVYENGRGGLRVVDGPTSFSKTADQMFALEKPSQVGLGSTVTLHDHENQRTRTFQIVAMVTQPDHQLLLDSANGQLLFGSQVGDTVTLSLDGIPVSLRVTHVK